MTVLPDNLAIAPWAHPELLVTLVVTIGGIGASAGFWEWMKARKRPTISADEHEEAAAKADAAAADELVTTALEIVKNGEARITALIARHDSELAKVNRRLDEQTARGDRLELEVANLRRESQEQSRTIFMLRTSLARVEDWWRSITAHWAEIRLNPEPPVFPTINHD